MIFSEDHERKLPEIYDLEFSNAWPYCNGKYFCQKCTPREGDKFSLKTGASHNFMQNITILSAHRAIYNILAQFSAGIENLSALRETCKASRKFSPVLA